MSQRYECGAAAQIPISTLSGQDAAEREILTSDEIRRGEHALIIGEPDSSAYAVTGTTGELREFLRACSAVVDGLGA